MSEPRGRGLVVECITIVFSILLAFAIDAAWDSRREREEELRLLSYWDQNDVLFMLDVTKQRLADVQAAIRAELGEGAPAAEANP